MAKQTLLINRPMQEALRCKGDYEALGLKVLIAPVFAIKHISIKNVKLSPHTSIIMTSSNALNALCTLTKLPKTTRIFCVGRYTANLLSNLQYTNIVTTDTALNLYQAIKTNISKNDAHRLIYLSGKDISFPLSDKLHNAGFLIDRIICYYSYTDVNIKQHLINTITNNEIQIITFYSLLTLNSLLEQLSNQQIPYHKILALCISDKLLHTAQQADFKRVLCAIYPNHYAMVDKLKTEYQL